MRRSLSYDGIILNRGCGGFRKRRGGAANYGGPFFRLGGGGRWSSQSNPFFG